MMAVDRDLLAKFNFRRTIEHYCDRLGWTIQDLDDRSAVLRFNAASGTTQTLFIVGYDTTLEFSVPSALKFDALEDIPGWISTLLLCRNSEYRIGFWCVEKINHRHVFSVMHNAEINRMDVDYFRQIVLKLIKDCDEFEQVVETALLHA